MEWLLLPGTNEEEETDTEDEDEDEDEDDEEEEEEEEVVVEKDAANIGAPFVARLFALSR